MVLGIVAKGDIIKVSDGCYHHIGGGSKSGYQRISGSTMDNNGQHIDDNGGNGSDK